MATNILNVKHGWVWALSLFIFFLNTFLLPEGFTYTLLLTPVWIYLLHQQGRLNTVAALLVPLIIYTVIHLFLGVYVGYYFLSLSIMISMVVFVLAVSSIVSDYSVNLDLIFRDIIILNFILTLASIPLLFIPALKGIVWYTVPISPNIVFPRLKLFTEEASHYSFLLAIPAIYFFSRMIFFKTKDHFLTLLLIVLPLVLSFSLGVLGCLFISGLMLLVIYFNRIFFTAKRKVVAWAIVIVFFSTLLLLYKFYPGNPLYARIHNIFTGDDTSARGRTYEAFILAHKIIAEKSYWWGIGPGQLKILGREIIIQYYYYFDIPKVIRIPNACAETIVYFGYVGFAIRMIIELSLFFTTKVYQHPYRFWLFLFVFIYQFTGSYITNAAEYLAWIIAFCPVFPDFIKPAAHQLKTSRI